MTDKVPVKLTEELLIERERDAERDRETELSKLEYDSGPQTSWQSD